MSDDPILDPSLKAFRRVVTGTLPNGRSAILSDAASPHQLPFMGIDGFAVTEIWQAGPAPVDNGPKTAGDPCVLPLVIAPPAGGSIFRMTEFPPESSWRPEPVPEQPHPHMHATATLDYAIVIEGEIVALLDEGEAELRAGDVVIQRGTRHAWANRSKARAVIAFVMIDAEPLAPVHGGVPG